MFVNTLSERDNVKYTVSYGTCAVLTCANMYEVAGDDAVELKVAPSVTMLNE